jgi:hypothetical protein
MERFINENFHDDSKDRELLDTTTGDAIPRSRLSPRNWAKEKYYPKGIAFLQKAMFTPILLRSGQSPRTLRVRWVVAMMPIRTKAAAIAV